MTAYRGHIENGNVVLQEPLAFPDGMNVTVFVEEDAPGNEAAAKFDEIARFCQIEYLTEIEEALVGCRTIDSDAW